MPASLAALFIVIALIPGYIWLSLATRNVDILELLSATDDPLLPLDVLWKLVGDDSVPEDARPRVIQASRQLADLLVPTILTNLRAGDAADSSERIHYMINFVRQCGEVDALRTNIETGIKDGDFTSQDVAARFVHFSYPIGPANPKPSGAGFSGTSVTKDEAITLTPEATFGMTSHPSSDPLDPTIARDLGPELSGRVQRQVWACPLVSLLIDDQPETDSRRAAATRWTQSFEPWPLPRGPEQSHHSARNPQGDGSVSTLARKSSGRRHKTDRPSPPRAITPDHLNANSTLAFSAAELVATRHSQLTVKGKRN
jgi:hypothetical protein